jgi:Skp family chaperone for outer membrane proteins
MPSQAYQPTSGIRIMKHFVTLAGVGAIVMGVAVAHTRTVGPSFISVSLQRLAAQSSIGKKASQELDALRLERNRELATKQKELEDVARQLTRSSVLLEADRARLTQDENRRRAEIQQLTLQAQVDVQAAQARLQTEFRGKLAPILADIGKRYGTDVVLNADAAVVWAAPGTDATDEALRRLNALPQ